MCILLRSHHNMDRQHMDKKRKRKAGCNQTLEMTKQFLGFPRIIQTLPCPGLAFHYYHCCLSGRRKLLYHKKHYRGPNTIQFSIVLYLLQINKLFGISQIFEIRSE
uniref:Uncharacterized protein n=1 Tax=Arundo donax TaxID=35708 RepID=A0A0A9D5N9_ARUDO